MSSPLSPPDSQQGNGSEFLPPPITRRATIGDPVGDNAVARQRRKTTVTACDRCRRRKIRCDGERPCQTCARFGVRCFTTEQRRERSVSSTAETAALADRVRLLEARLAASESQVLASNNNLLNNDSIPHAGPPSLRLNTNIDFVDANSNFSFTDDMGADETSLSDDMMGLCVPTIQITGPHGTAPPSPTLPSPNSPAPSLFSGTSNASTPDMLATSIASWSQFDPHSNHSTFPLLSPTPHYFDRTPPVSQWAEVYDQNALLVTPGTHSRRSSISSFGGLPEAFCDINLDFRTPSPQPDWSNAMITQSQSQHQFMQQHNQQQPSFDLPMSAHQDFAPMPITSPSTPAPQPSLPSKVQAEFLSDRVFSSLTLPVCRNAFKICLESVYSSSHLAPSNLHASPATAQELATLTPYTPLTARCLVYLVLTIGYHLVGGGREDGAEGCYAEVVERFRARDFWAESGAKDVVALLGVLAEVNGVGS